MCFMHPAQLGFHTYALPLDLVFAAGLSSLCADLNLLSHLERLLLGELRLPHALPCVELYP